MEFTESFLATAGRFPKPYNMSLEQWYELIGKDIGFVSESEVYKPVKLLVDVTKDGRPTEIIVSPWRENWYSLARNGIAAMMGIPDPRNVELVDDFEEPISNWDGNRLMSYKDTIRILYGENPLKLKNPPKQVDTSINPQKDAIFHEWWGDVQDSLEDVIAKKLRGTKDQQKLTDLCAFDGAVEEMIRDVLKQSIDTKFIVDHSANAVSESKTPVEVVKDVSGILLTALRYGLRHSAVTVEGCLANYVGESILGNKEVDPISNEYEQYKSIAHRAMRYPMGNDLLIIIKNGKDKSGGKRKGRRRKRDKAVTVHNVTKTTYIDPHAHNHPYRDAPAWWYGTSMYPHHRHHKHYYSHGHPPTSSNNNIVVHTRTKSYKGNHEHAVKAYHSFAGRPPVPTKEFMKKTLPGTQFKEEERIYLPATEIVDEKVGDIKERNSPISNKSSYTERDDRKCDNIYGDINNSKYWINVGADVGEVPDLDGEKHKVKSSSRKGKGAPKMIYDSVETKNSETKKLPKNRILDKNYEANYARNLLKESRSQPKKTSDIRKQHLQPKKRSSSRKKTNSNSEIENHRPKARLVDRSASDKRSTISNEQYVSNENRDFIAKEKTERNRPLFGNETTNGVKTFAQLLEEQKSKRMAGLNKPTRKSSNRRIHF